MIAVNNIKKERGAEIAAVILCCRVFFETATPAELKEFIAGNDIDWYAVIRIAAQHRIRPVVYKILHGVNIPDDIKVLIYKQQTDITTRNFKQAVETERIILLLKQNGIEAVPYKGTAFSKQFFGDLVSRESSDIDLVIQPADIDKTVQVLKQDKYLPEIDDVYTYLGAKYERHYKDYNLNKFENGKRLFHVELHWAVAEVYLGVNPKVNSFIYKTEGTIVLARAEIVTLNKTAHFSAMLVHHGIKDTFRCLKNIVDISMVLQCEEIQNNRDSLNKELADAGIKKIFDTANQLSGRLFGVVLQHKQNLKVNEVTVNYFCADLLSGEMIENENFKNIAEWIKRRIMLQDTLWRKLNFLWVTFADRFTPTETDFRLVKLPMPVFFIYYLMKPFRTLIKPMNAADKKRALIPVNKSL